MRIVLEVLEGRALKSICRELGLNRHSVRSWISRYHLYGEDGLCVASSTKRSTAIEKEKIVIGQGMEGAIGKDGDSEEVGIN